MRKIFSIAILMMMSIAIFPFEAYSDFDLIAEGGYTAEELDTLKQDRISGVTGTVKLEKCHFSIKVPNGYMFLNKEDALHLICDYWGNPESNVPDLVGCLVPSSCMYYYQIPMIYIISYDNCGYIEDDDANSIDYDELLEQIQDLEEEENKSLSEEQRSTTTGWAVKPKYMADSHVMVWAKFLKSMYTENVNYDIRILGKDGLVSINAVIDTEDCKEVIQNEKSIINCLEFDEGYAYKDFDPSRDKVSEWTIEGLVAGCILIKTGLFVKIGIFLLKFWKIISIAIVGGAVAIRKFFKKK